MTQQAILSPERVIQEFKDNGVTHVVYLPDSETNWMYQLMEAEPSFDLVSVTREGESIAIAAGLIAGGKKPVVLIQNTGMFESGDSIRGIALHGAHPSGVGPHLLLGRARRRRRSDLPGLPGSRADELASGRAGGRRVPRIQ